MSTTLRLVRWLWRAWPVIVLLGLLLFHLALIHICSLNATVTNKTIALISQLTGGFLVLYSIDSNIGVIRGQSIFAMFKSYLREFPLIRRSIVLEAEAGAYSISGGKATLTVTRNPKSVEERLEYLQEQINEVRSNLEQEAKDLHKKLDDHSKELKTRLGEVQTSLKTIEIKIDEVSVGGISAQLFGVLLLVYGSITDYVA